VSARRRGISTALAILILIVLLFPVYWMVNTSLQPNGATVTAQWFPFDPSFHGYEVALAEQAGNILTSVLVASGSVVLTLFVAAPAAYAIAQALPRRSGPLMLVVLVTQMIPGIVVANALYVWYSDLGLLNTIPGLILADSTAGIPFAIIILQAFMAGLPVGVLEAARMDGAGQLRVFLSIAVPMSRNALITSGLFAFLFSWSDFLFALTLTTSPDVRPVTLGIYSYLGAYVNDWSPVMATSVLASLPAVVLLLVAQKYIAAGTTAGAVK